MKALDQRYRDLKRKTYRITFPNDLEAERVIAWVRAISGTLRGRPSLFTGVPTIAFEMTATNKGIVHRLRVPWQHAEYVIPQLHSLVPGIGVSPEEEFPPSRNWTRALEVGLTTTSRQLNIYSQADTAASLLASVQALDDDEAMLIQWVVTPAVPRHPPVHKEAQTHNVGPSTVLFGTLASKDEIDDRRKKLEEPNMLAVLRVAATANTPVRAEHLLYRVRAALASTRGPSTRFTKRFVPEATLQRRIQDASAVVNFPITLNAPELAALIAWPIGNPFVAGLPAYVTRRLPAPESVPQEGRIIGRSTYPGRERRIAVSYLDALKHVHVAAPTGAGKTALLANMFKQDVMHGYGAIVMESKGDLFEAALNFIPRERMGDVIVLDVSDISNPVGFNVLEQGDTRVVIDEVAAILKNQYAGNGIWTDMTLYHGLRTITSMPNLNFMDLPALLMPVTEEEVDWREGIMHNLKEEELRSFWQRLDKEGKVRREQIAQPAWDRLQVLASRPELRNILGQTKSSFKMADVIKDNKILLINLAGVPRESASLMGTLLFNSLWYAARTEKPSKPNFLYLDEFQSFLTLPIDPEDMLAKARGFGLGMVLAHQHLGQLGPEMKRAVLANARTKVFFQTSADDARTMSNEFGNTVSEQDFLHLGRFEALARIATNDGISPPLTLATYAPAKGHGGSRDIRQASQQQYGRKVADVEAEMRSRRTASQMPNRRTRLAADMWGKGIESQD